MKKRNPFLPQKKCSGITTFCKLEAIDYPCTTTWEPNWLKKLLNASALLFWSLHASILFRPFSTFLKSICLLKWQILIFRQILILFTILLEICLFHAKILMKLIHILSFHSLLGLFILFCASLSYYNLSSSCNGKGTSKVFFIIVDINSLNIPIICKHVNVNL